MSPKNDLREICNDLGLSYQEQDWGVINADPSRLDQFVAYYLEHSNTNTKRYFVGELILASLNAALLQDMRLPPTQAIASALADLHDRHPYLVEYWSSLPNSDEFQISDFLMHLLNR